MQIAIISICSYLSQSFIHQVLHSHFRIEWTECERSKIILSQSFIHQVLDSLTYMILRCGKEFEYQVAILYSSSFRFSQHVSNAGGEALQLIQSQSFIHQGLRSHSIDRRNAIEILRNSRNPLFIKS